MVVAHHQISRLGAVLREGFIAFDELAHAVGELKHAGDFSFRNPADAVDAVNAVPGWKIKLFFHGPDLLSS